MTGEKATSILLAMRPHNNGLRTMRECAELAGVPYDEAKEAVILYQESTLKLMSLMEKLEAVVDSDDLEPDDPYYDSGDID